MTTYMELFYQCPSCAGITYCFGIHFGWPFGRGAWTDGLSAPIMVASDQEVIICPHCDRRVWFDDMPRLHGPSGPYDLPSGKIRAKSELFITLSKRDFLDLADGGELSPGREVYVRTCAWWIANARHRDDTPKQRRAVGAIPDWSAEDRANLERLEWLLRGEPTAAAQLRRAEALRELGRFDEVAGALGGLPPDHRPMWQRQLRQLAQAGDGWVAPLCDPEEADGWA